LEARKAYLTELADEIFITSGGNAKIVDREKTTEARAKRLKV
jgi:hypothetical protein